MANHSIDQFKKIKHYNDLNNIKRIQKKERIRFGFVVYTSSMWNVDELYHYLVNDKRFDTSIIVAHFQMADKESSDLEYSKTVDYFNKLQYNIIEAKNIKRNNNLDILFYLTPITFSDNNVQK